MEKNLDEIQNLISLKNNNELNRLGKLFNTEKNKYFYDTGTGKVIQFDDSIYAFLSIMFSENSIVTNIDQLIDKDDISLDSLLELDNYIRVEDLFHAPKPVKLTTPNHEEKLEESLNKIEQIILELTGKCNLRCKYCIYNDLFKYNRSFNKSDMSIDVAKAAVDYLAEHGRHKVAVTFYGGEPLVRFDLLQQVVDYAKTKLADRDLSFSITTNMTLVTEEIADYLANVSNLNIVCSMDGPKPIHDAYRVFADSEEGSFDKALIGLELLCKAVKKANKATLTINGVFAPPYSYQKAQDVYDFFSALECLPKDTTITLSYAVEDSVPKMDKYTTDGDTNPLWHWMTDKLKNEKNIQNSDLLNYANINRPLVNVHNRFIFEKANGYYPFNGCCVPGARRLYISTDGEFSVCERIGTSPSIGNVYKGLNVEKIRNMYIKDVSDKSIEFCSKCWGLRMCPFCYAERFDENGLREGIHELKCDAFLQSKVEELKLYYTILENEPTKLEFLKKIILS